MFLPALRGGVAGLVAGALLLSWTAAFAWWWLLPASQTLDLTIPNGTAGLVAAGEAPSALPRELVLRVGDTLSVRNLDSAAHRIGPLWIAAGAQEQSVVGPAFFAGGALICTVHPAGALSVTPRARPGIAVTIPVTLMAAIPMIWAILVATSITRRLDSAPDLSGAERTSREPETGAH